MNITVSARSKHVYSGYITQLWDALIAQHGHLRWPTAEDPWQTVMEVILTQSAGWPNVQKSIDNLKAAGIWTPAEIREASTETLETLLRPSRFYRSKTKKVQAFAAHLEKRTLAEMFTQDVETLRDELMTIHGIGAESADTLVLYAAQKPSFVVDTYTYRILNRLGWVYGHFRYEQLRDFFMHHVPADVEVYNTFHALFVRHGAQVCTPKPKCGECQLQSQCAFFKEMAGTL